MKITCVIASPRPKGNTAAVANRFCDAAEKLGASVQRYSLNTLQFKGCQGCMGCKTKSDKCVLQDDLAEVLESVAGGDVLVMATPIYLWDVTGLLRSFIERTYSYFVPDFPTAANPSRLSSGKKLVFIQTQGQPHENLFADTLSRIEPIFKRYGFTESHLLRVLGVRNPGQAAEQANTMQAVEDLAKKVVG
jgi:multimeric flavodoxin WrbA